MKRQPGMVVLALLVGGVGGSVLSYYLSSLFADGPVRRFFFSHADFGIPAFALKLGFMTLTFGVNFSITSFTVLLILLLVWLVGKL